MRAARSAARAARSETATMRSSSSRSPEAWSALMRRLGEASRRVEVLASMSSATAPDVLGVRLSEALAKAYDSEISFVLTRPSPKTRLQTLAATGLTEAEQADLPHATLLDEAGRRGAATHHGDNLLGRGARSVAVAAAQRGAT